MVDFTKTREISTDKPVLVVEPGLPPGKYTVSLTRIDNQGKSLEPVLISFQIIDAPLKSSKPAASIAPEAPLMALSTAVEGAGKLGKTSSQSQLMLAIEGDGEDRDVKFELKATDAKKAGKPKSKVKSIPKEKAVKKVAGKKAAGKKKATKKAAKKLAKKSKKAVKKKAVKKKTVKKKANTKKQGAGKK